jgi:hypothetical protein
MYLQIKASITAMHIVDRNYAALSSESFSVGHICFVDDWEWYQANGHICRAHKTDVIDIGTGNRMGRSMGLIRDAFSYAENWKFLGSQFLSLCERGLADQIGS